MKVLAVDLGGTHATCALVEDRMCVESVVLKYHAPGGLEPLLPEIERTLDSICQRAAVAKSDLAGVAIAFCGLVDSSAGRILSTNGKFPDATTIDLPAWAEARLGIPLRVENDARMALLGEHYAGAARGVDDVVMITLGTGIGGAAMIEGSLLRGRHFQAGCLGGHLPVSLAGHICTCGALGCAEAEASGWALPNLVKDWAKFEDSSLSEGEINFKRVFSHAAAGDIVAIAVREHCLRVWSANAVALIHAYDPTMLVYGGGVMKSASSILPAIQDYVARYAWTPWGTVQIKGAELGDDAGIMGAVPLFDDAPPLGRPNVR
jgi:glucokinase